MTLDFDTIKQKLYSRVAELTVAKKELDRLEREVSVRYKIRLQDLPKKISELSAQLRRLDGEIKQAMDTMEQFFSKLEKACSPNNSNDVS